MVYLFDAHVFMYIIEHDIDCSHRLWSAFPFGQCAINHVFEGMLHMDVPFGGMGD